MKKITFCLATTIVLLFLFSGCDKYHRDRYIGTWEFVTEKYKYIPDIYGYLEKKEYDTTFYYSGKISIGQDENFLIIKYTEKDEITVGIDKDGYIGYPCPLSYGGKYTTGKFESKNQMYLEFDWKKYTQLENGDYYGVGEFYKIFGTKK